MELPVWNRLWLLENSSPALIFRPIPFSTTWRSTAYIARMKKRRKASGRKGPVRSWVDRTSRPGFRGYPIATVAFYGPNDKLATKVVVSVFLTESDDPDLLQRWFSDGELEIREDRAIGEQILTFLKQYGPRSTVVTDGVIGCPHEEGVDYPEGTSCPLCSYWAGRDRFTHERIQ
jgi:hypothetical protein